MADSIEVQLFDVDVRDRVWKSDDAVQRETRKPYKPNKCKVHILGKTIEGHSVYIRVRGFRPWLFVGGIPKSCCQGQERRIIEKLLQDMYNLEDSGDICYDKHPEYHIEYRSFLNGWIGDPLTGGETIEKFLWYRLTFPSKAGRSHGAKLLRNHCNLHVCQETDDIVTQFFTMTNTQNNGWARISARKLYPRRSKTFACDLEFLCTTEDITTIADKFDIAPLRLLSWDIETFSVHGTFPEPEVEGNYILNIGNIVVNMNAPDDREYGVLFCLKETPDIEQEYVKVLWFESEEELLLAWWDWIVNQYDPDVMISYNGRNFDWNFVYVRSRLYPRVAEKLSKWSRLRKDVCEWKQNDFNSKQRGEMKSKRWEIENYYKKSLFGRFDLDLFIYMHTEYKLRSYSLNYVSNKFLQDKKVDLPHNRLWENFATPEGRKENAVYCIYDCRLPVRLVLKLQCLISRIETSRISFTSLEDLQSRGQSARVMNQMIYNGYYDNFVINPFPESNRDGYEGATVIEPHRGFYEDPITTLDFKSLYPSLMMAYNTCYSTLVRDLNQLQLPNIRYEEHPIKTKSGDTRVHYFVTHVRGLLPKILENLLKSRSSVKKQMAAEPDPFKKAVLDKKQLAIKVMANSVYGFTGCSFGRLPCLAISETVTYRGRTMIERTKRIVEETYDVKKLYGDDIPPNVPFPRAQVIYGDSVTEDTPIICRYSNRIVVMAIKDLFEEHLSERSVFRRGPYDLCSGTGPLGLETSYRSGGCTRYRGHRKEYAVPKTHVEVWSDRGFTKIQRIIRHRTRKRIYRIRTPCGYVKVTEDHSLLNFAGQEISPKHLRPKRTRLLASPFPDVEVGPYLRREVEDQKHLPSHFSSVSDVLMQRMLLTCHANRVPYRIGKFMDWDIIHTDKSVPSNPLRVLDSVVLEVEEIPQSGEVEVYDLQTFNHHFAAGVGHLVVHNTDSVMVRFPVPRDALGLELSFKWGAHAAEYVTSHFRKPVELEFEKVYDPYYLIMKKRYVGLMYTSLTDPPVIDKKGLENVRRDTLLFTSALLDELQDALIKQKKPVLAQEILDTYLKRFIDGKVEYEQFILSKSLKSNYANPTSVEQWVVMDKIRKRNPGAEPKPGSRVPFVYVYTRNRKAKGFDRVEDPEYAKAHNLKLDLPYYLEHKVQKPLVNFLEPFDPDIVHKLETCKACCEARIQGIASCDSFGFRISKSNAHARTAKSILPVPKVKKRKASTLMSMGIVNTPQSESANPESPAVKKSTDKKKTPAAKYQSLNAFFTK
jgi:DNA polymerase elongation subunit (family B)